MKKFILIITLVSSLCIQSVKSQIDNYSIFNGMEYNFSPVYAGDNNSHNVDIIGYLNRIGTNEIPKTFTSFYTGYFKKIKSGFGYSFENTKDNQRAITNTFQYNYRLFDNDEFRFVIGSQLSILKRNKQEIIYPQYNGSMVPNYVNEDYDTVYFNLGIGGLIKYNNFNFSMSYHNFKYPYKNQSRISLISSYNFNLSENLDNTIQLFYEFRPNNDYIKHILYFYNTVNYKDISSLNIRYSSQNEIDII
jgi:hypothetical protein